MSDPKLNRVRVEISISCDDGYRSDEEYSSAYTANSRTTLLAKIDELARMAELYERAGDEAIDRVGKRVQAVKEWRAKREADNGQKATPIKRPTQHGSHGSTFTRWLRRLTGRGMKKVLARPPATTQEIPTSTGNTAPPKRGWRGKMSDVTGITELMALQHMADPEVEGYGEKEGARIEALLRNRQEMIQLIEVIKELNEVDMLDADKIDELYAKAKELGNE